MCKIVFTLCMIICISQLAAQSVGINTDGSIPPVSAMFEVKSTNKGILIPRVALVSTNLANPVPVPANSLLVYNTAFAGTGVTAVTPGYYYWNGEWIRLLTTIPPSATDAWYLLGNSGINPATQFIGTKDNQPLIFKVNNVQAGKLSFSSLQTFFGVEAGRSMTTTSANDAFGSMALYSNTSGARNTAIGVQSLYGNTGGSDNVGIGISALSSNLMGNSNVAIGSLALSSNNGNMNTAIGKQAMVVSELGDFNTALGGESLFSNTNGDYNTAIGYRANFMRTNGFYNTAIGSATMIEEGVNYSTAIGHNAYVACNSCLVLGGSNFPYAVNVGIGTYNPTNALHIQADGIPGSKSHILLSEQTYDEYVRIKMVQSGGPDSWTLEGNPANGPWNARFNLTYNVTNAMSITGEGNMMIMGTLTQNSDSRLKTNISMIPTALSTILNLNGYQYNWKDASRDQTLQTGVLAQEVQHVLPHLVREDEKGFLSVNYSGLVPYLIESVKEQQQQIDQLKKENAELKKLKEDVEALKKMVKLNASLQ